MKMEDLYSLAELAETKDKYEDSQVADEDSDKVDVSEE